MKNQTTNEPDIHITVCVNSVICTLINLDHTQVITKHLSVRLLNLQCLVSVGEVWLT